MNIHRFQKLLNAEQDKWLVLHINHNPITKVATLVVNHLGKDPGKLRSMFKLDKRFARKQAKELLAIAMKYGPKVVPKFKRVGVEVR